MLRCKSEYSEVREVAGAWPSEDDEVKNRYDGET